MFAEQLGEKHTANLMMCVYIYNYILLHIYQRIGLIPFRIIG